jgi:hypothetical protein
MIYFRKRESKYVFFFTFKFLRNWKKTHSKIFDHNCFFQKQNLIFRNILVKKTLKSSHDFYLDFLHKKKKKKIEVIDLVACRALETSALTFYSVTALFEGFRIIVSV